MMARLAFIKQLLLCIALSSGGALVWAAEPIQPGMQAALAGVHSKVMHRSKVLQNSGLARVFNQHSARSLAPRGEGLQRMQSRRELAPAQRSMSEAIAIAKQRVPGEVVSARKRVNKNGDGVYLVKILSRKGVVQTVRVRATK